MRLMLEVHQCFLTSQPCLPCAQCGKEVHGSCEAYDAERDEWRLLSAPLLCPRKYHAAVALNGRMYALGGMTAARRRLASVEAYDPREGRCAVLGLFWQFSPSTSRCCMQAALSPRHACMLAASQMHPGG